MFSSKKKDKKTKEDPPPTSTSRPSDEPPHSVDAPPPQYQEGVASSSRALPPYRGLVGAGSRSYPKDEKHQLPSEFIVGKKTVSALITLEEVRSHTLLLGSFHRFRVEISNLPSDPDLDGVDPPLDGDAKWAIFVRRAVWRFEKFWEGLEKAVGGKGDGEKWDEEMILPPLDVLMVWHTYLLNPRIYHIDLLLRPALADFDSFPLLAVASQIDPSTLVFEQTPTQASTFSELTNGLPPTLPSRTSFHDTLTISCPCCSSLVQVPWISIPVASETAYVGKAGELLLQPKIGTGYAQEPFRTTCGSCGLEFGRKQLALRKFAGDMGRVKKEAGLWPSIFLVPETGVPTTDAPSRTLSTSLVALFSPFFPLPSDPAIVLTESAEVDRSSMLLFYGRDMKFFHDAFDVALKMGTVERIARLVRRMGRIWSRYDFPEPFGVELVGAVLRQGSFIEKMEGLGWIAPYRFDESDFLLLKTIGRYHAFVDLMSSQPWKAFCPTLDIDLGWHTHQLKGSKYRSDTLDLVGRFTDHDDTVEENALESAYRFTATAWTDRFGVPYSTCGCAPETPTPLPSLGSLFKKKKKSVEVDEADRIEMATNDSTHPSAHPSILAMGHKKTTDRREYREETREKLELKADQDWIKKNPGIDPSRRNNHTQNDFFRPSPYTLYYGVGEEGAYPGSVQAWGLGRECSFHDMDGRDVARGSCAANLGVGGGGKIAGGGIGPCASSACIGSGSCASGAGAGGFGGCSNVATGVPMYAMSAAMGGGGGYSS